jgi:hypothetical protein
MSVDMDEEEVISEMNVDLLFESQNTQDESSSSIEFPLKNVTVLKRSR